MGSTFAELSAAAGGVALPAAPSGAGLATAAQARASVASYQQQLAATCADALKTLLAAAAAERQALAGTVGGAGATSLHNITGPRVSSAISPGGIALWFAEMVRQGLLPDTPENRALATISTPGSWL